MCFLMISSFIRTECGRSLCATLLFSCLLRLSTIYWVCREEHDFECVVHKQGAFFSPIISAVSLTIFVLFGRILLQRWTIFCIVKKSKTALEQPFNFLLLELLHLRERSAIVFYVYRIYKITCRKFKFDTCF